MRRYFLLFTLFISPTFIYAQTGNVGIGTVTPSNRLHVVNTADPLRLEGVASGAATDSVVTINATGVIKKRTTAAFIGSSGWSLTGNGGVNAATNFIGTTTLVPLIFRTNTFRAGQIDPDSTKRNNSFGHRALNPAVTGTGNNAFGYQALARIATGVNNTGVGDFAGTNLTTGSDNLLLGADAGYLLTVGTQNIALGSRALASTVAGSNNVALGNRALENNVASSNIAIGSSALISNVTGSSNIAIGNNSLGTSTVTSLNVAIGHGALGAITTGSDDMGLGYRAAASLTTGTQNTALGYSALSNTLASNYCTMVGYQAGNNITGGSNNTFIGYNADATVTLVAPNNSSALGSGATVTQSNMIRIGNTTVTRIEGQVGFSVTSDARVKENVKQNVRGLDFIGLLKPVTYNYNLQKIDEIQGVKTAARVSNTVQEQIRYSGLVAQDVLKAAQQVGYDFSGVNKPENDKSLYSIDYAQMVVPLIQAVQDLKAIVDKQQAEIEELKKSLSGKK